MCNGKTEEVRLDGWPELEDDAFIDGNKLGVGLGSYSSYATEIRRQ